MPLRSIVQKFVERVDNLEAKSKEGDDLYEKEFQELKTLSDEFRTSSQCCCIVGEQDINRRKNRYKDILPYDSNRVVLSEVPGVPGSNYINASYIKGASGSQAYIASQAPLPHTVDDFWRMIWECEVQVIVMASNEIEGGRPKCERYWPNDSETKQFGAVSVSLVQQRVITPDYNGRQLKAVNGDVTRRIHHFHYHTWPDHGVPVSVNAIIDMVTIMRSFQGTETLPVLVHCSAGCGRTGTVCAIDYVCGLLRTGKLSEDFSIKQLVLDMRRQRIAMVQTRDQYILVHRAVRELFIEHLKVIDSHPYENIDFAGRPKAFQEEPDYENITANISSQKQGTSCECKDSQSQNSCSSENQGQNNNASSDRVENVINNDKLNSLDKLTVTDNAPPLPVKTKIRSARIEGETSEKGLSSSREASPNTPHRSRNHSPILPRKSKMEYVNDWCEGLTASKQDDVRSQNELFRNSDPKIMSLSTSSITPNQSASPSPSSKRSKTPEHNRKVAVDRPKISNLVRKPSIAKLRALFESDGNTDSSSPPSPESWAAESSGSKLKRERAGSESSALGHQSFKENDPNHSPTPGKRKNRFRSKRILIDHGEYEALLVRYEDAAYRIFKENRQSGTGELGSQLSIIPHPSPSLSARSAGSTKNGEEILVNSSPNADTFAGIQLRRSGSNSHSPSPAPLDTSTSTSESVAQQAKELVGRLVGSRRNSFAEKRNSTWYDDEAAVESLETDKPGKLSPPPYNQSPNRVALLFSGSLEKKVKSSENKKPGNVVKRSFSMKVGFPSPLIRRKRNGSNNVAAYLAVEDSGKSEPQVLSPNTADNKPIIVSGPKTVSRRPHGYVNVKPVQNPTFCKLIGDPVELTKFKIQDDNGEVREFIVEDATRIRTPSPFLSKRSPSASPLLRRSREASPVSCFERTPSKESSRGQYGRIQTSRQCSPMERSGDHSNGKLLNGEESLHASRLQAEEMIQFFKHRKAVDRGDLHTPTVVHSDRYVPEDVIVSEEEPPSMSAQLHSAPADGKYRRKVTDHDMPILKDGFYGTDMDEYCQKIIHDCQEYLVNHHQYSNLTPEAQNNLHWIEETLHQNPRKVIVDATSFVKDGGSEPRCSEQFGNQQTAVSNPDYERLWFSRSGQVAMPAVSARTKLDLENTSAEEVTFVFPPHEDDGDSPSSSATGLSQKDKDELLKCFPADYELGMDNKGYTKFSLLNDAPQPATRAPKDIKFSNTVRELKHLIDELEVDIPAKPRKPQPAPRTILPSAVKGSPTLLRHGEHKLHRSENRRCHVPPQNYEYGVVNSEVSTRAESSNFEFARRGKLEDVTPLQSTPCVQSAKEQGKSDHEYEEIYFKDSGAERPQQHAYDRLWTDGRPMAYLQRDSRTDNGKFNSTTQEKLHLKGANCAPKEVSDDLYGQVHKPRRKKQHGSSHSSVRAIEGDNHWRQETVENDYELLSVPPDWKSLSNESSRPVAPPRLRRNPSSSTVKPPQEFRRPTKESSRDPGCKMNENSGQLDDLSNLPRCKWEAEFDDDDDDDNVPPVPAKTKDAYRLPKAGGHNQCCSPSAETSNSGTNTFAKALNSFPHNLFSKFARKTEKDSDSSSIGSGVGTPPLTRKISQKSQSELGFPNRLEQKPKGPRDPPAAWKVTA